MGRYEVGDHCPFCERARAVEQDECLFMQDGLECVDGILQRIVLPEVTEDLIE